MLKIYLDWNCITNNRYGFVELARKYRNTILFPYTREHIRDLLVSSNHKEEFKEGLYVLEKTCGDNFLKIYKDEAILLTYNVHKYYRLNGWIIKLIQKPFNLISKRQYKYLRNTAQLSEKEQNEIRRKDASEVIEYLDRLVLARNLGSSLENFTSKYIPRCNWLYNTSSRLNGVYFALDMLGYHSDKKSEKRFSFTNLAIDANHVTNAIYCDCFITADCRQRIKAEAIYARYGCPTKIFSPEEIKEYIENNIP